MSLQLIIQGLIEITISLLTGLLIFFGSFKIFALLTGKIDELSELEQKNTAVGILLASFVFGIMFLVKSAIGPSVDTLTSVMNPQAANTINIALILLAIARIIVIYIAAAIFAFIILWLSMKLFMLLTTSIDEMDEIKNSNTSVSILIAVLIISITIILSGPLTTFLKAFSMGTSIAGKEPFVNVDNLLNGLIQLGISFFAVIFIYYLSFRVFNILTRNIDEIQELKNNNTAIAILMSAFIFGMMLIIMGTLTPAYQALDKSIGLGITSILFSILRILGFFAGAAIFGFFMLWLAMKAFMILTTKIDEMAEIKSNNIAIAIIIGILLISAALLLQSGLTTLLNGLVPYPKVESGLNNLPIK